MPTFRHGKNTGVVYDKYDLSTQLNSVQYQMAADLAETTAFGSSARSYMPGFPGGTVSFAGMFSGAATDVDAVFSAALSGTAAAPLSVGVESFGTRGRRAFLANVWDTSYSVTSPVNDVVAIAAEFSYDSKMDSGWIIQHQNTFTSTVAAGAGVSVDTGTTSSVGFVAHLHVYTNTRDAGSVTVVLHDSADNSSFALIGGGSSSFTAVNGGVTASQRLEHASQTVRRYIAPNITVTGGTTGSYAILVTMAKR